MSAVDVPGESPADRHAAGDAMPAAGASGGPGDATGHEGGRQNGGRRRYAPHVRWGVSAVALFFILEYLLLPDIGNARHSLNLLGKANVAGLIVGACLEAAALAAYAELSHTVLSPEAPRRFSMLRVNMSSLAVSHVLPGGTAPGTAVSYRLLTDLGVPPGTAAFGLATQGVGSAVVLNAIFWLALLISIPLTGYNPLYGFAAMFGVILFVLFAGTVLLLTRGERRAAQRLQRVAGRLPFVNAERVASLVQTIADRLQVLLRTRRLLVRALASAAAFWLLDASSFWVFLLAFGRGISPINLLVAYGLANVLAVIPVTPSGLGIVEGVLIPTLVGFHVTKGVAILGVLAWRFVNFWLPIPLGGAAYLSLRLGRRRTRAPRGPDVAPAAAGAPGARDVVPLEHLDAHDLLQGADDLHGAGTPGGPEATASARRTAARRA